jgi:PTS system nitrogen regulatory IIA component
VKFKELKSIVCIFARLSEPIDFDSNDGEPVDLVFLLLAPEHASGDHLKALARISRVVREPAALERLRSTEDVDELKAVLAAPAVAPHAA